MMKNAFCTLIQQNNIENSLYGIRNIRNAFAATITTSYKQLHISPLRGNTHPDPD